jgi:hypothetical protein
MPAKSSGARFATAPISMPPALPPCATMRPARVYPAAIIASAQATKSVNVFGLFSRLPSRYQRQPFSVPPRIWAIA